MTSRTPSQGPAVIAGEDTAGVRGDGLEPSAAIDADPSPGTVAAGTAQHRAENTGRSQRRTQAERSEATRLRLLEATIQSLITDGYAQTSTVRVCELAGASRGAMLHHFATRADLMAAAVEYLAVQRTAERHSELMAIPPHERRPAAAIAAIWSELTGDLFRAALELWVAARTDPELHVVLYPIEARVGRMVRDFQLEAFGIAPENVKEAMPILDIIADCLRGMAVQRILHVNERRERDAIAQLEIVAEQLVEGLRSTEIRTA